MNRMCSLSLRLSQNENCGNSLKPSSASKMKKNHTHTSTHTHSTQHRELNQCFWVFMFASGSLSFSIFLSNAHQNAIATHETFTYSHVDFLYTFVLCCCGFVFFSLLHFLCSLFRWKRLKVAFSRNFHTQPEPNQMPYKATNREGERERMK